MSESFVKPFSYLYEESDKVIEQGTKIPAVNQWGKTPDIEEQIPVEIHTTVSAPIPTVSAPVPVVELPHEILPQPAVIQTTSPPIEPEPSTIVPHPGKNIQIGVSDSVASTDQ